MVNNYSHSVGAIEPQFYQILLEKLEISDDELPQFDNFDELKLKLGNIFACKTRDEWSEIFGKHHEIIKCRINFHADGTDACVAPVLDKEEAGAHHHNKERNSFLLSG